MLCNDAASGCLTGIPVLVLGYCLGAVCGAGEAGLWGVGPVLRLADLAQVRIG